MAIDPTDLWRWRGQRIRESKYSQWRSLQGLLPRRNGHRRAYLGRIPRSSISRLLILFLCFFLMHLLQLLLHQLVAQN